MNQSWPRKEIIIVDDGSKDATLEIAKKFEGAGVLVVSQSNAGAAAARNRAFSLAQGEYIQWLDADDLLGRDKVRLQMATAVDKGPRYLISGPWGYFRHRAAKAVFTPSALWQDCDPLEWLTRKWEHNAHMQTATWLVSRELTEASGPWDTRLLNDDDGEYFFRVIQNSDGICFVADAKVFYRIVTTPRLSVIGRCNKKKEAHALGMENQIRTLLGVENTPRVRNACIQYIRTWIKEFYPDRLDLVDRLRSIAEELGGDVPEPSFGWKYDWIRKTFGMSAAKNASGVYNALKAQLLDKWDFRLSQLQGRHEHVV
jgi:glycosyltransferase involved in cell wall biosynthesis